MLSSSGGSSRREHIFSGKGEFKQPEEFQSAVSAEPSPTFYEEMWRRLITILTRRASCSSREYCDESFIPLMAWGGESWIPGFLQGGLINSQKEEVAWLQRKGYPYTEVEVDLSKWGGKWLEVCDCFTSESAQIQQAQKEHPETRMGSPQLERC